ncbi:MAG: septum formation initiator family protein [Thiotrichales bacterium]|nr:septum formation initiator family protein [Thiotrichales bacterium]
MKILYISLALIILVLQARLLSSEGGISELFALQKQLNQLEVELAEQQALNAELAQEVKVLQTQDSAIETIARQTLGMVAKDEVFIEVIELPEVATQPLLTKEMPLTNAPETLSE